jgi:precorrin-4/cobalt-precorrin-4 C11-methyltransferase
MITFVGAGPGDPELVTVKGMRALQEADLVLYAGSLVPREVLTWTREGAECHDSAALNLEEQVELMVAAVSAGRRVVRLHTGDPSIYGAIGEQMRALDARNIAYRVIPGVSSFLAAAAALPVELTLPGVTQTIIITRAAGRTPVPERENLTALASHQTTMAIFLSSGLLAQVVEQLSQHRPGSTPVALVQRASWPEQKVVRTTLAELVEAAEREGIDKTAMLLVGEALANCGEPSKLYDALFTHGYREAKC